MIPYRHFWKESGKEKSSYIRPSIIWIKNTSVMYLYHYCSNNECSAVDEYANYARFNFRKCFRYYEPKFREYVKWLHFKPYLIIDIIRSIMSIKKFWKFSNILSDGSIYLPRVGQSSFSPNICRLPLL